MKYILIFVIFVSITFCFFSLNNANALEDEEAAQIDIFFKFLKEGDTDSILNLLTDPLLTQKKAFFENNQSYSNFLKKTYKGSILSINNIERLNDMNRAVDVEIRFRDGGNPHKTRFILKRIDGIWKISQEIMEYSN